MFAQAQKSGKYQGSLDVKEREGVYVQLFCQGLNHNMLFLHVSTRIPSKFPYQSQEQRGLGLRGGPPLGRLHGGWEATWTQHLGMVIDGDGNVMEMLWMGLPMVEMLWMINDG